VFALKGVKILKSCGGSLVVGDIRTIEINPDLPVEHRLGEWYDSTMYSYTFEYAKGVASGGNDTTPSASWMLLCFVLMWMQRLNSHTLKDI
jgi:hypothetical protein